MMGFGGGPSTLWGWVRLFMLACIDDVRAWFSKRRS
jgi:hypothetical protein